MSERHRATRITLSAATVLLAVTTGGCATTHGIADSAWKGTRKVATGAWDGTRGAFVKLARYLKKADVLKKQHDGKEHDHKQVEKLLGRKSRSGRRKATNVVPEGQFAWPVEAGIISSEYGPRWGREHKGIDIAADTGEPILAAGDGEVIYAGDGLRGYGNVVILRHENGVTTLYAHNSELKARVGQRVKVGETIALLGSTGHSTGPHCHFEIRSEDGPVDPRAVLQSSEIFRRS